MTGQIVDLFAGGGGASLGIEWALGRSPDVAINHDPEALAMHAANHPATFHLTENVWKADPFAVTGGRPVDLLWLSPDCRHHSKAKGGAPVSRSVRSLADVALYWAKVSKPEVIALENVEEWRDWGPLDENGHPCKAHKGHEFFRWVRTLESMGYEVNWFELRACDYGAPTIRKRLFLIARRDGYPILRPEPTHGDPKSEAVKTGKLEPYRTAAEIIDWSLPCPSIFLTREDAKAQRLKIIRPLAPKTMSRIARGFKRYVLDRADPFIVTCNHAGDGFRGQGLGDPFATVAAARDAHGIVTPYLAGVGGRMGQSGERPVDKPYHTITTKPDTVLVAPALAPFVSYAQQGGANRAADDPLHTVCASTKDQNQIVAAYLHRQFGNSVGSDAEAPVGTVTAGGGGKTHVAAAFLAQHNGGARGPIGRDAGDPVATITTEGSQVQPVMAYLSTLQNNTARGDLSAPVGTVLAGGQHHSIVTPFIQSYYSNGGQDQAADRPLGTVPTKARFSPITGECCTPPLADWQIERARAVAAFLRAEGVWSGGDFVTVGQFIVWDIGMRMLTPRELARAQGFPDSYDITAKGTLTETAQRHKIGNSVSPYPARALLHANMIVAKTMPKKRRQAARIPDPAPRPPITSIDLFGVAAE